MNAEVGTRALPMDVTARLPPIRSRRYPFSLMSGEQAPAGIR